MRRASPRAGPTASGGSRRISIPIDEDGDGTTENHAFVDTLGCSDGPGYANWAAFAIAGWANLTRADGSSFENQGDCIQ